MISSKLIQESCDFSRFFARLKSVATSPRLRGFNHLRQAMLFLCAAGLLALTSLGLAIAPAGEEIGNQASAEYLDANGDRQLVYSNAVTTRITQLAGILVQSPEERFAADGEVVYFPLTVSNTGNGDDTYVLSGTDDAAGFSCEPGSIQFFNSNGGARGEVLANNVTPVVPAGQSVQLFVSCESPLAAQSGSQTQIAVTATSNFDPGTDDEVIKALTISETAFDVIKRVDPLSGDAGIRVTVSLDYQNTGSVTEDITITDELPAFMTYVENTGVWTFDGGQQNLTDTTDGNEGPPGTGPFLDYQASVAGVPNVTAIARDVPPNAQGLIQFDVLISADAPAGEIANVARWQDEQGQGGTTAPAIFTVASDYAVALVDPSAVTDPAQPGFGLRDDDGLANDTVLHNEVDQDGIIRFANVVVNQGNVADRYRMSIDASFSGFPANTNYQLLDATDTPLIDDVTPLVQPGERYVVILRVNLPPGFDGSQGGPHSIIKKAASVGQAGVEDSIIDRLGRVEAAAVDLTNDSALPCTGCGDGQGPEPAPVNTVLGSLGETVNFTLYVNNASGATAQDYLLTAASDPSVAGELPNGWSVVFRVDEDGIDSGAPGAADDLTQEGDTVSSVPAGGAKLVFAEVTLPASGDNGNVVAADTYPVYFKVESTVSGVSDVKHDAVTIAQVRSLELAGADNNVTVRPGACVTQLHQLTNNGNVLEGTGAASSTLNFAVADGNASGFITPSSIYWDRVNPTIFDDAPDDPLVGPGFTFGGQGLAPGETREVWIEICARADADAGAANTVTLTVSADDGVYGAQSAPAPTSVEDTAIVVDAIIDPVKTQAADVDCDGVLDSEYEQGQVIAKPGECVCYKITATNIANSDANNVKIQDATPLDTTYFECADASCGSNVTSSPGAGGRGVVTGNFGANFTLSPGQSVDMQFCVQIDDIN